MNLKVTSLLLVYHCFFLSVSGQEFLQIGNQWIFERNDYSIGNGFYSQTLETITIEKDTSINGLAYSKLAISHKGRCELFGQVEFLRSEGDKIFRLSQDGLTEYLMIDFGAQQSFDLIYESFFSNQVIETTAIIDSIGVEILPNGDSLPLTYLSILNNMSFDDNTTYKLSDKIGFYQLGLLFPDIGTGLCDTPIQMELRCFISKTDTLHFKENLDCFEIEIVNNINEPIIPEVPLYPNPTNGFIHIPEHYIVETVFDALGQEKNFDQIAQTLELQGLSGIYYILLKHKQNDQRQISRVIKN